MASLKVWLHRKLKDLTIRKLLIICSLLLMIFNEYLIYTIQSFRWSKLPERDPHHEMVLLLVSDPQIIGHQDERGFPVGMLARWDSDRYLRHTFSRAYSYANPDVIIFLGDLMDEGSKATANEYESYASRFHNIFKETRFRKTIYVPGDNDIGGEGGDFRTPFKVNRFEKHFENLTGVVTHKFIDFLKLDIRTHYDALPEKKYLVSSMAAKMEAPYKIIVNHETLSSKFKSTIYPILKLAQPTLVFSGHWHVSQMFTCDTCLSDNGDLHSWPIKLRRLEKEESFIHIDLSSMQSLTEVMIPTCSYRMGVPHMGYGVAIINKSGSMKYAVLWLPSRYTVLKFYLVGLGVVIAIFLIDFILSPLKTNRYLFS